jgi:L-alanine-DL-glutamate epimerase-like enolase superfamily enzyme
VEEYALLANLKSHAKRVAEAERELAELLEANWEVFSRLLEGLALRLKELARELGMGDGERVAPEFVLLARLAADCLLADAARKMGFAVADLAALGAASLDLAAKLVGYPAARGQG